MPRELNKELFRGAGPANAASGAGAHGGGDDLHQRHESLLREMSLELARLKRQVKDVEAKADAATSRLGEWARGTKNSLERLQGHQTRMEQLVKAALQDLKAKLSTLAGKFTERRGVDSKVQELIDRHNQVLQSFEARMTQMQKIVAEQEMKIMAYQSALKELQRRL